MTLRRITAVALYVLPLLLIAPSGAAAQTDDDQMARRLFETGRAYFERAQYDDAAEAFAEAYRLSERPTLLVNLARALEEADRIPEAIDTLTRALGALPADDEMRPQLVDRLARLQAEQERAEAAAAAEESEAVDDPVEEEPWEADPDRMWWSGVGTVSLGGASLVVALGAGVASHNIHQDLKENCPMDVCLPEYEDERDRGEALSATATAFVVIGVASSVTGLVLMLLSRDRDEEEPEPAIEITAGPGQVGTGLRLRF